MKKLAVFFAAFTFTASTSANATMFGALSNFDVMNDTGQPCQGFEIELDDTTSKDITYTFDYQRYGTPKIVDGVSSDGANRPAVYIRWQSPYDPTSKTFTQATPVAVNPSVDTGGHLCFPGNIVNGVAYEQSGCEHFGIGTLNNPSNTIYRWMIEDPATPGALRPLGTTVSIPAPVWNVLPNPVNPAVNPPVVQAVLPPPPAVVAPAQEFYDAMWVKIFKTESPNQAELNHLVTDDPAVPQEPVETEIEWMIWQPCNPALVQACENELINEGEIGKGNESVTRRYEFYKYVGAYDPESHEARLNPNTCQDAPFACDANGNFDPTQPTGDLGDYIGAQMAAVNIDQALATINTEQPQGEVAIQYPDRPLIIGGSGVYDVTVTNGAIPPGLSLNPLTGLLSGAPTQAGDYLFTVQATDIDAGGTVSGDFHIVIADAVSITTATLPTGLVGQTYSATIEGTGGVAPYFWTVTGVAGDLSITDNVISGTPTATQTLTINATITDALGGAQTKSYTLTIVENVVISTALLPDGVVGQAYNAILDAVKGASPYVWTITGLPPGVTAAGNTLSGTPTTPGIYSVNVSVSDTSGGTDAKTFSVKIISPVIIATTALKAGVIGQAYSDTVTATGGLAPYSWTITGLPNGITATGNTLSGTPTVSGTFTVNITVMDTLGTTDVKAVALTVMNPAPPPPTSGKKIQGKGKITFVGNHYIVVNGVTTVYITDATKVKIEHHATAIQAGMKVEYTAVKDATGALIATKLTVN